MSNVDEQESDEDCQSEKHSLLVFAETPVAPLSVPRKLLVSFFDG